VEVEIMMTLTASQARSNIYKLLDKTAQSHEPIQITGKRNNGVLLAEDDWRAIKETLYLLSVPGMRESVRKGLKTPLKECDRELEW
jgi:PHD/YefM family antitoxin component YafN of YafNO toxin-antitoxin module